MKVFFNCRAQDKGETQWVEKKKDNTVCSLFVEIARHQKVVQVGSSSRV